MIENIIQFFILLLSLIIPILLGLVFPLLFAGVLIFILNNIFNGWKKRTPAYQLLAQETGLTYFAAESISNIQGAEYFRIFNLGSKYNRQIQNMVRGTINGFQVSVFDYTYYVSFGNRKIHRQTIVMIEAPQISLPLFSLRPRPEGLLQKMNILTENNIEFPQSPNFSDRYELTGRDERRIRQFFNNHLLNFFCETGIFSLEGGGSRFVFYREDSLTAPESLRPMLNQGLQIAKLLSYGTF